MKKKIIISIIVFIILMLGIISFIFFNNRTVTTITLDINPSVEINLAKNEKVKSVIALNEDAKNIITGNLKNKSLDDALEILIDNIIKEDYIEEEQVTIILHSTGNIDSKNLEYKIQDEFNKKSIFTEIIVIDNISKEAKKIADKYNISEAKATYINSISKNNNLDLEILAEKRVDELKETKETGKYCDEDYTLSGDFCLKEIERKQALDGMICPEGYYEYNGTCYESKEAETGNNLICNEIFTKKDDKCVRTDEINATPTKYNCEVGEAKTRLELGLSRVNDGDHDEVLCVDYSSATHPVTPCELPADDPTERTSSGGRCYWHRRGILANGCPGAIQVNGYCWDDATNVYICAGYRDGKQYKSKDEYCEHSIKYLNPTVLEYSCPDSYILDGDKCIKEEIEDAQYERYCNEGYTLVDNNKCLNKNNPISKINGLVCTYENSKLKNNICIIYDIVPAKHAK